VTSSDLDGFVSGHQLSSALYDGFVAPALARRLPDLRYAAALIGHGSDVLGFDTTRSTDHDWGPRLQVIVDDHDLASLTGAILQLVDEALPDTVLGVPVDLRGATNLPGDAETHHNSPDGRTLGVTVTSVRRLQRDLLGTDDDPRQWEHAQWLTTPRQSLLEFTAGPAFRDDTRELSAVRQALAWYPHDVWLYVMSGRWQRIAQMESFVGRAAEAGDHLGSQLLAGQITADVMHLALLQRRIYAPYAKWLGSSFARHEENNILPGALTAAVAASSIQERQTALVGALLELSRRHDALQVTAPVRSEAEPFFGRPYPVIWSERIARSLHQAMRPPLRASLPFGLGGIDELTNGTDALKNIHLREAIATVLT
jgi:Domain of unknown function (DUF4037)